MTDPYLERVAAADPQTHTHSDSPMPSGGYVISRGMPGCPSVVHGRGAAGKPPRCLCKTQADGGNR